jgi:MFS family permease
MAPNSSDHPFPGRIRLPTVVRMTENIMTENKKVQARRMVALCTGVALMNGAMAITSVASTLVTGERLGPGWAAVPNTAAIIGTGFGAAVLTSLMRLCGRRATLVAGYLAATAGAFLALGAVASGDIVMLVVAMVLIGIGNAGAQLSRYAAADLYAVRHRGQAIGVVVWSAAVGAVGGPLLLGVSDAPATALGLAEFSGPFAVAVLTCVLAAAAMARFRAAPPTGHAAAGPRTPLLPLLRGRVTRSALAAMVTGHVVMAVVMTASPLHMHMHGHGLDWIGMALSAHTFGMFAFSPLTGRLCDRVGPRPVVLMGYGTLLASTFLIAVAGEDPAWLRPAGLFLLGYGWNLCFVAGSNLLATRVPAAARTEVEGAVDTAVWTTAAVATLASTPLLTTVGYEALCAIACGAAAVAALAARPPAAPPESPEESRGISLDRVEDERTVPTLG